MLRYPDFYGSSFTEFLQTCHQHLLPSFGNLQADGEWPNHVAAHGTTILALKYQDGVMLAGDRRATEGFQVSARRIEKVYKTDEHSAIAIAGAAGPCLEMVKLFQTELEHYEKIEGELLGLEGKANKLAKMVSQNLPAALQGLVVIPIFAGYDHKRGEGRVYKYDLTGGVYEEDEHAATGSGGRDARNTLKKLYRADMEYREAIRLCLEALYDAADEDIGTAGADLKRDIYPTVMTVMAGGIATTADAILKEVSEQYFNRATGRPS